MIRIGLPQPLAAALARAVPDLPSPAAPPWAHLCEAVRGLGQALRAAGFTDIAVHRVTHYWQLPDPALFSSLPAEAIGRAAVAFGAVVREQSTSGEGMPQSRHDRRRSAR